VNFNERFEVFTAVTLKNVVFLDVTGVALVRTDVTEEHIASVISVTRIGELGTPLAVTSNGSTLRRNIDSVLRLLVTANVVRNSPILVTLITEVIPFSETSALTRATERNITEDGILQDSWLFYTLRHVTCETSPCLLTVQKLYFMVQTVIKHFHFSIVGLEYFEPTKYVALQTKPCLHKLRYEH
jgi:hypothetical protein